MRNGCLSMVLMGLILAGLVGLFCSPFNALAQEPAMQPRTDAADNLSAGASPSSDTVAPGDTVAAVAKAYKEMGLPMIPETEEARMRRNSSIPQNEQSKGLISGQVLTEDGQSLEQTIQVSTRSRLGGQFAQAPRGVFSMSTEVGKTWVHVDLPGYAPTAAGPFEITEDKPVEDVIIVLTRGISMQVQVRNPQGKPVPGAKVTGSWTFASASITGSQFTTDEQGNATLEHVIPGWVYLQVSAPEYYPWARGLPVAEGTVKEAVLAPIDPISGQVTSKADGKPIPDAQVFLVEGPFDPRGMMSRNNFQPVATTDTHGRFFFQRELSGSPCLMIMSPDHRAMLIGSVNYNQDITCQMPEPLYVHGTFTGNLNRLQDWSKGRMGFYVELDNPMPEAIRYQQARGQVFYLAHVDGGKAEFDLPLFAPGKVGIQVQGKIIKEVNVTQSIPDLVIDLDQPDAPAEKPDPQGSAAPVPWADPQAAAGLLPQVPMDLPVGMVLSGQLQANTTEDRDLVLKFIPPPGAKEVLGVVQVRQHGSGDSFDGEYLPVKDNQVTIKVKPGYTNPMYSLQHLLGALGKDERVTMPAGNAPVVKEIRLQPAGAVRCTVVNAEGDPVSANEVFVNFSQGFPGEPGNHTGRIARPMEGKINDQTVWLLTPVPLGVPVQAFITGSMSDPVTLTPENPVMDVQIVIAAGHEVKVHLLRPDGKPATGVTVSQEFSPYPGAYYTFYSTRTDGSGDYFLGGINDRPNQGTTYVSVKGVPGLQPIMVPVDPKSTEMPLQLKAGLRAHGQVVDAASGRPVIGIKVIANVDGIHGMSPLESEAMQTDGQGRFAFTQLGEGTYRIYVDGPVTPKLAPKFMGISGGREEYPTFQAGQTKDIRVEIVPYPGAEKRLRLGDAPATQPAGSSAQPVGN